MKKPFTDFPVKPVFTEAYLRRCARTLDRALREASAYAAWRAADPGPDRPAAERYAALPVLTKADLRAHFPVGFTPRPHRMRGGIANGAIEYVHTSGTTDERVTKTSGVMMANWRAYHERRGWPLLSGSPRRHRDTEPEGHGDSRMPTARW
ncbi:MAG: hypothetical protein FJ225_12475, partial [Lentisphaerae bacterium]|nr:hypothetical protein [Lentisphaerota bacterium]